MMTSSHLRKKSRRLIQARKTATAAHCQATWAGMGAPMKEAARVPLLAYNIHSSRFFRSVKYLTRCRRQDDTQDIYFVSLKLIQGLGLGCTYTLWNILPSGVHIS